MKTVWPSKAFTIIELLIIVAMVAILAAMLLPAFNRGDQSRRALCAYHLKQIGNAYSVWASDHLNAFPLTTRNEQGGLRDMLTNANQGSNCWRVYATMAQELGANPKMLVCPTDERRPAAQFVVQGRNPAKDDFKDNSTLSYFAAVDATYNGPTAILAGDRNLGPGPTPKKDYGFSPNNNQGNDVTIATNTSFNPVCWSWQMHAGPSNGFGNILMSDTSVRLVSTRQFQTDYQPRAGLASAVRSNEPLYSSFRLIFP